MHGTGGSSFGEAWVGIGAGSWCYNRGGQDPGFCRVHGESLVFVPASKQLPMISPVLPAQSRLSICSYHGVHNHGALFSQLRWAPHLQPEQTCNPGSVGLGCTGSSGHPLRLSQPQGITSTSGTVFARVCLAARPARSARGLAPPRTCCISVQAGCGNPTQVSGGTGAPSGIHEALYVCMYGCAALPNAGSGIAQASF